MEWTAVRLQEETACAKCIAYRPGCFHAKPFATVPPAPTFACETVGAPSTKRDSQSCQCKSLPISAVAAAESAGMSRTTPHRIERGEPSVTAGAFPNAMTILVMESSYGGRPESLPHADVEGTPGRIPARIH